MAGAVASWKDVDGFSLGFILAFDFLYLAGQNIMCFQQQSSNKTTIKPVAIKRI